MSETTAVPPSFSTQAELTFANHIDHFLARVGYRRGSHRVTPGLYRIGNPGRSSPVFVTGNYTLSFDALRSVLKGIPAHILVLDTKGINVWCAAGKGTFGTDELVHQIEATQLAGVVDHRSLVLPQLGAPGVSAHEVKKRSGFRVEYGPVRARDLPEYLKTRKATPEMRLVRFPLWERFILTPIELVHTLLPMLAAALVFYLIDGLFGAALAASSILAGSALFPILLPWIPGHEFSLKGFILGWTVVLFFTLARLSGTSHLTGWSELMQTAAYLLGLPPVTAFLALNFTGSTTFTSPTAVRSEIFKYVPIMAWSCGAGIILLIASLVLRFMRG